jgi:hypothetical protein
LLKNSQLVTIKMFRLFVVLCCVLAINAQIEEVLPAAEPYSFAYISPNEDGTSSSREETSDANRRVVGSYTIQGADGQSRRVEYVADENGFRANVITNEIGTESQNSADVQFQSSAPTAAELSHQWTAANLGKIQGPVVNGLGLRGIAGLGIRSQIGLVQAPIAPIRGPIGGGIGIQTLRVNQLNQGLRVAAPLPVARAANIGQIAPLVAQAPIASLPVAPVQGLGITRGTHLGLGLINQGVSSLNLGLAPIGVNTLGLNHLNQGFGLRVAAPLGGLGVTNTFQQLGGVRGLQTPLTGYGGYALGNLPLNAGANLLLVNGGVQPQQLVSGASVQTVQLKESDDDYKKSK